MLRDVSRLPLLSVGVCERGWGSPPPAGHLGKRASGRTFSTGAEGAGGFHSARKTPPPINSRAITSTNAIVTFPMPANSSFPISDRRTGVCRLTTWLQNMLVPFRRTGNKSGERGGYPGGDWRGGSAAKHWLDEPIRPSSNDRACRFDGCGQIQNR